MQNVLGQLPFNISLLILTSDKIKNMRPVKALDIFETVSHNFHPDGLFSVEIFGKKGDEKRNRLFSYCKLNVPIFHPLLFKKIVDLRELYGNVLAGTKFVTFNKETKDFEESNALEGQTGYTYFVECFPKLQFEQRKSTQREFAIQLIEKYRKEAMMDNLIVMPAGIRDYEITPEGKPEEDEINNLYRRVIAQSNLLLNTNVQNDLTYMNSTRYALQTAVNAVYEYIINLLEGKSKMVQGWWAARDTFHSTRNVITSTVPKSKILGDELTIGPDKTVVGLYQTIKSIYPVAVNLIREFLTPIFPGPNAPAYLVNPRTLMRNTVDITPQLYDDWMTPDGIEAMINQFEIEALRHEPVMIGEHCLGLIYNDGKHVKFMMDGDDKPKEVDKKYITPITYAEFYYLAIFQRVRELPALFTRYPVLGMGGIYPCWVYLKTTTRSQSLMLLDDEWKETGIKANEFPVKGSPFVNSMSPSITHTARLGADYDGDVCSVSFIMSEEGVADVKKLLGSREFYVGIDGKSTFSASNPISELVFAELTS